MPDFDKLIEIAKPLSLNNPRFRKHVSIVLRRTKILGIGINERKTHPECAKYGYLYNEFHSELSAFFCVRRMKITDFNKLSLVNFRFDHNGKMKLSKPCEKCFRWCEPIFSNIWYSTENGMVKLK